uniref:LRR receptor-like serine/threonine-protein kinase n=1 Tax=Aegilops tauschii subsp. strangulata TaxID=200361 RepID=A0A453ND95_AEGTS
MEELPSSTPARPLQVLNISSNLFTGAFLSTWQVMNNLVVLNASNNSFSGQIPSHFCSSSSLLAVVELCYNQFTGSIPPGLGNCSMLRVLKAGHNNLRGALPNELFDASLLEYLSLPDNHLDGKLDGAQIIKLRNLANLNLGGNNFSGEIPTALMEMPMLNSDKIAPRLDPRAFELPVYATPSRQYRITSAFPKVLNLGNNKFTGVIPEEIGQLNSLVILNFSSNSLSGEIPRQLCDLINLRVLDLSSNHLTGIIPSAMKNLHFLSAFNISHNDLEGKIPDGVQLSTFPNSSFEGNPKLCGHILHRICDSTEGPSGFRKHWSKKSIMAITFGVFFGGTAILFVLGGLLATFKHTSFI